MAYDDDDDLFGEEFDFVDEDDDASDVDSDVEAEKPAAKPKKRPAARDKGDKAEKAPSRGPKRARPAVDKPAAQKPAAEKPPAPPKREPRREPPASPPPPPAPIEAEFPVDDVPIDEPVGEDRPPAPGGPPADHVVHIYEYGKFKRTIDRKFTDEEAVGFAEEMTRTGKSYGRYAIATPDDEVPASTFAGAAKN